MFTSKIYIFIPVTIETVQEKKHIKAPSLAEHKVINSIVLLIDQRKSTTDVTLYIDCIQEGKISLTENLKYMFSPSRNPLTKVVSKLFN